MQDQKLPEVGPVVGRAPAFAGRNLAATFWATLVTDRISRPFVLARSAVANGRKTADSR